MFPQTSTDSLEMAEELLKAENDGMKTTEIQKQNKQKQNKKEEKEQAAEVSFDDDE